MNRPTLYTKFVQIRIQKWSIKYLFIYKIIQALTFLGLDYSHDQKNELAHYTTLQIQTAEIFAPSSNKNIDDDLNLRTWVLT